MSGRVQLIADRISGAILIAGAGVLLAAGEPAAERTSTAVLQLHARGLDQACALRCLLPDDFGQLGGRIPDDLHSEIGQLLADVGQREDAHDLAMKACR